jgi:hypothetical protein
MANTSKDDNAVSSTTDFINGPLTIKLTFKRPRSQSECDQVVRDSLVAVRR